MRRQRKPAPTVLPIGARLKGEGEMRRDRSLLLLGTGLVASLARPGGNVIGSTVQAPDLAGKRLGFSREVIPSLVLTTEGTRRAVAKPNCSGGISYRPCILFARSCVHE
jgi:hypothetical protein